MSQHSVRVDPLVAKDLDAISALDRELTRLEEEEARRIPHFVGFGSDAPWRLADDINVWLDTHPAFRVISVAYQPVVQPNYVYYTALVSMEISDEE